MHTKRRIISVVCLGLGFGLVGCDKKTASSSEKTASASERAEAATATGAKTQPESSLEKSASTSKQIESSGATGAKTQPESSLEPSAKNNDSGKADAASSKPKQVLNVDELLLQAGVYVEKETLQPYTGDIYAVYEDGKTIHWKVQLQAGKPNGKKTYYRGSRCKENCIYGEETFEQGKLRRLVERYESPSYREIEFREDGFRIETYLDEKGHITKTRSKDGKLEGEQTILGPGSVSLRPKKAVWNYRDGYKIGQQTVYRGDSPVWSCIYKRGRIQTHCTSPRSVDISDSFEYPQFSSQYYVSYKPGFSQYKPQWKEDPVLYPSNW